MEEQRQVTHALGWSRTWRVWPTWTSR